MHWWSVDPGAKHVGVAMWDDHKLVWACEHSPESFLYDLDATAAKMLVVESFSLLSPKYSRAAAKDAVNTILLIGQIQGMARCYGWEIRMQAPAIRHVAMKTRQWIKVYHESELDFSRGNDHIRSAIAHGLHYILFHK